TGATYEHTVRTLRRWEALCRAHWPCSLHLRDAILPSPTTGKEQAGLPMQSRDIQTIFTEFFAERGHTNVSSSSLIPPTNDPTVLLTTAGMQQMTPYFLGLETPPAIRMTSTQKCFRTVDID